MAHAQLRCRSAATPPRSTIHQVCPRIRRRCRQGGSGGVFASCRIAENGGGRLSPHPFFLPISGEIQAGPLPLSVVWMQIEVGHPPASSRSVAGGRRKWRATRVSEASLLPPFQRRRLSGPQLPGEAPQAQYRIGIKGKRTKEVL